MEEQNIIIYKTIDGKSSVALFAKDGKVWLSQKSIAELFGTSKQSISRHIINILTDSELDAQSVVKDFLTTASDGKTYNVTYYSLEMILAIGYRVHSIRGVQFRQWATRHLSEYLVKGFTIYAVTHNTAAEIITQRADENLPNMGLTSWKGSIVRKQDIIIAKII